MAQWLVRCVANIQVLGSNPAHIRACEVCFLWPHVSVSQVSDVTSTEAKQLDSTRLNLRHIPEVFEYSICQVGRLRGLAGSALDHR